ncbi:MAG: hypothetical protein FJ057_09810 [Cyanobacteria bacterium K_DeepCast_0m_m1_088]|nr:hypothetical protein [Cyanobacteria bacterium K_DeepCast_0m_m1_088]
MTESSGSAAAGDGIHSPLEGFSRYRGEDWTPERLAFHQNLEQFADRVGLIVGLQGNGKISQEAAYDEIKQLWKSLRGSRSSLLD